MARTFKVSVRPKQVFNSIDELPEYIEHPGDYDLEVDFEMNVDGLGTTSITLGARVYIANNASTQKGYRAIFKMSRVGEVLTHNGLPVVDGELGRRGNHVYFDKSKLDNYTIHKVTFIDRTQPDETLTEPQTFYAKHTNFHLPSVEELHVMSPTTKANLIELISGTTELSKKLMGTATLEKDVAAKLESAPSVIAKDGIVRQDTTVVVNTEIRFNLSYYTWKEYTPFSNTGTYDRISSGAWSLRSRQPNATTEYKYGFVDNSLYMDSMYGTKPLTIKLVSENIVPSFSFKAFGKARS